MQKPYRRGVLAIIIDKESKYLIVQKQSYKENEWNFVGGGREEGESVEENLFREVKEETGLDRSNLELVGICQNKIQYDWTPEIAATTHGGKYRGQLLDYAVVRYRGKKEDIKICPEELRKYQWVEKSELKNYLIFPNQYDSFLQTIKEFDALFCSKI